MHGVARRVPSSRSSRRGGCSRWRYPTPGSAATEASRDRASGSTTASLFTSARSARGPGLPPRFTPPAKPRLCSGRSPAPPVAGPTGRRGRRACTRCPPGPGGHRHHAEREHGLDRLREHRFRAHRQSIDHTNSGPLGRVDPPSGPSGDATPSPSATARATIAATENAAPGRARARQPPGTNKVTSRTARPAAQPQPPRHAPAFQRQQRLGRDLSQHEGRTRPGDQGDDAPLRQRPHGRARSQSQSNHPHGERPQRSDDTTVSAPSQADPAPEAGRGVGPDQSRQTRLANRKSETGR